MFGIGMTEMIVIVVLALLVLGPDRIPAFARTLARIYREVRTTSAEFTEILKEETRDVRGVASTVRKEIEKPLMEEPETPRKPRASGSKSLEPPRSRTQTKQVQDWSETIESSVFNSSSSEEP